MSLAPLLSAPWVILLHTATALAALTVAAVQLTRIKAGGLHRTLGWAFVLTMAVTALSSFWIVGRSGHYSWIHILSVLTLAGLPLAVHARRRGDIARHKRIMLFLVGGLVAAGAFTLLPGRILGRVVLGG